MTSLQSTSPYTCKDLPDVASWIRLVEFYEIDHNKDEELTCVVWAWPLEEAPDYQAVSYTWGPALPTENVYVKSQERQAATMTVRTNCADVLRQIKHLRISRYYWIDTICINQAANIEKSAQVAMMAKIYGRAQRVLACLGTEKNDGDFVMRMLSDCANYVDSKIWADEEPLLNVRYYMDWRLQPLGVPPGLLWLTKLARQDFHRFLQALFKLGERPYFTRLWILQELFVAQEIAVVCSYNMCMLQDLVRWWLLLQDHNQGSLEPDDPDVCSPRYRSFAFDLRREIASMDTVNIVDTDFFDMLVKFAIPCSGDTWPTHSRDPITLQAALNIAFTRFCLDPRDIIYGTSAFIRWSTEDNIEPDYDVTAFDLFIKIAQIGTLDNKEDGPYLLGRLADYLGLNLENFMVRRCLHLQSQENVSDRGRDVVCVTAKRRVLRIDSFCCYVGCLGYQQRWRLSEEDDDGSGYLRIFDHNGVCCGLTSIETHRGDFFVRTSMDKGSRIPRNYVHGLVVRQINIHVPFLIIGGVLLAKDKDQNLSSEAEDTISNDDDDTITSASSFSSVLQDDVFDAELDFQDFIIFNAQIKSARRYDDWNLIPENLRKQILGTRFPRNVSWQLFCQKIVCSLHSSSSHDEAARLALDRACQQAVQR